MEFYFAIPYSQWNLYSNSYIDVASTNCDVSPVNVYVWYYGESDWLDFSYDEQTHQVTFWATYFPQDIDYAYVIISSDEISQSAAFMVKIGDTKLITNYELRIKIKN